MNNSQYCLADELPSCWFFINWSLVSFQRCVCTNRVLLPIMEATSTNDYTHTLTGPWISGQWFYM